MDPLYPHKPDHLGHPSCLKRPSESQIRATILKYARLLLRGWPPAGQRRRFFRRISGRVSASVFRLTRRLPQEPNGSGMQGGAGTRLSAADSQPLAPARQPRRPPSLSCLGLRVGSCPSTASPSRWRRRHRERRQWRT